MAQTDAQKASSAEMSRRRVTIYLESSEERDLVRKLAFDEHRSESAMARELCLDGLRARGMLK